jgi:hypothetical protein
MTLPHNNITFIIGRNFPLKKIIPSYFFRVIPIELLTLTANYKDFLICCPCVTEVYQIDTV